MPSPTARFHHYVPEFYLAGFTLSGDRDDLLWVRDHKQKKSWQARPANAAGERDFYRIDGEEPNAVEQALGDLENHAAEVLRRIQATRALPEGDDLGTLLGFLAFQITRVPQFREMFERNHRHLSKAQCRMALSHPRFFEQLLEEMRREGKDIPRGFSRETILEFLEDESRYTIEIPQELSIRNMAWATEALLPILAQRNWLLFIAKDDQDDFVCTDRPVILTPTQAGAPPFIGFGNPRTEVIMPISRQMALAGRWDHESCQSA